MSGKAFNYQAWTKAITKVSLVELDLQNMAQGINSRITTSFGVLSCAVRILQKGWDQTSGFIWKLKSEEDWER